VAGAEGGGGVHACAPPHPCRCQVDLIGSDARRRGTMIFIYFKNCYCNGSIDISMSVATVLHNSDELAVPVGIVRPQ
jgi:hypothetical protein